MKYTSANLNMKCAFFFFISQHKKLIELIKTSSMGFTNYKTRWCYLGLLVFSFWSQNFMRHYTMNYFWATNITNYSYFRHFYVFFKAFACNISIRVDIYGLQLNSTFFNYYNIRAKRIKDVHVSHVSVFICLS